jgi:hypothetical protein
MMTGFLILTNLSHLPTGFLELYNLIARLGLQYDYQSYVLFLSYGIGIYIISRSWVVIFRWIIFQLVRREYVIDLDYQAVKPIVYGFRPFPLFWKFPRLWFRDIFESPKPFRRSVSPEQPDDAVYYYGGPNPNMVIFDPYTGSVIFLLIKDLIHENYRIYYKLLKFAARKLPIQLLPMHEKIWSFSWVADARRRSRARSLRSRAPYYYYTRRDIQSDYWLNRFLVLEDATKDNSEQDSNLGSEDNEKSFFDTHLWESVWLRGFGRSMPSHIPANLVQHNFLNPFLDTRWSRPGIYPSQFREDYQDLLMFRLRYLFRQSLNINQSIGLIPSEIGRGQLLFDSRIGSVDQASGIGMRNFILSSLGGSGRDPNLGMYFDIGDYVSQVIYRLQIKYFQEVQCFIPERNRTLPDRLWFLDRPLSFFMLHPKNQILSYSILTRFILRKLSLDLFNKYSGSSLFQSNFTDCYNVCRLERSFSQAIYGGQPRPLASLSVPINWFGFCGRDLRQNLVGDEVTSLIDRFATLDRSQYSFERIFSNLPSYNYLVKQPSEFYGIFETPDESQPDSQQGRFGRFCFVNSRILLENDRKSKVNNFFVDLNTWSIRFGGFRREESSYFESLKRYTCQQYFILGMVAYQKLRSSIPLVTQALSLSRVGGLELSSTQFYKLGLINFNLDTSITQTNPQFLTREERYYGKLPFVGFTHAVLADPSLGPSHRRPALQGLSITGSDIPLAYVHSPTSILYSNSFFMQSFYSQVCPSMCSRDYFSSPSTAVLSSARFKLPMFYPIFDRWFMNSIPRGVVLSPSILNGMSSGYITGVAFKHFRRFPVRPLRVVYDTHLHWRFRFSGYYGSMHILTWWCRYVFSHPVPVIPYCWVTKKSKLPLFHQLCFDRRSTTRSRTRTAYRSRRWRYNWGVKFVWSVGSVARFEYYSATEQSRLVESFADRVETYSSSCSAQPIESGYNLSKFWLHVTPTTSGWFICSRDL